MPMNREQSLRRSQLAQSLVRWNAVYWSVIFFLTGITLGLAFGFFIGRC